MFEGKRGERGHRVHHVERGMAGLVDGFTDFRHAAGDSGGSLIVYYHDCANLMIAVRNQPLFYMGWIHAMTPVAGNKLHVQSPAHSHLLPERGEMPGLKHKHLIARR